MIVSSKGRDDQSMTIGNEDELEKLKVATRNGTLVLTLA